MSDAPVPAPPPPAEVVIGVDCGTTAAKVSAFGLCAPANGMPWRHTAVREYPLLHPSPGWAVQQPDVLITAVFAALTDVVAACHGARVLALSLSSAMHGLIGLDSGMRALTPLVTWADSRAAEQAAALKADGVAPLLLHRSGTPVHSMSPLTKLLWFRAHEPALFGQVRYWIGLKDRLVWALTGVLATELSCASGTGLLDVSTGDWSAETLALAGVEASQLPPVLDTTAALGLGKAPAAQVGLPVTTPVVLGAGDGPLGNLGTGAIGDGVAGLSIGTSGAIRTIIPKPEVDADAGLFCYALTRDAWALGGAISNGGSVLRWAGDVFGPQQHQATGRPDDAAVLALATSIPPGSDGLVALPYLMAERAPLWDPTLAGAFLGVRAGHTRGHFVRAGIEGVAQQLWTILARLDRVTPISEVRATGGVFRSALWRQILADVLDRPVTVTDGAEGSALGAAALGLVGIGRAPDPAAALAMLRPDDVAGAAAPATRPDPAVSAVYADARSRIPALVASYATVAALFE